MRRAAAGSITLCYRWVPSVGLVHALTSPWSQENITLDSTPIKKRDFYGRPLLRASRAQARPKKSTNNEEISKVEALWRAGEVTKPKYVKFCNQIHLLDLQANKRGEDGEGARKAKQNLMMDLVGCKTTLRVQNKPERTKGLQARRQQAPPRKPNYGATTSEVTEIGQKKATQWKDHPQGDEDKYENTTTNGNARGVYGGIVYSTTREMQNLRQKERRSSIQQPKD